MRPIDADALKEMLIKERDSIPLSKTERYSFGVGLPDPHGMAMRGGVNKAFRCMENTPTIDPESLRPQGEWEWREEWETHHETRSCDLISCGWYCTKCGIELGEYLTKGTGVNIILDIDIRKPTLAVCPNCGAKMKGADDHA